MTVLAFSEDFEDPDPGAAFYSTDSLVFEPDPADASSQTATAAENDGATATALYVLGATGAPLTGSISFRWYFQSNYDPYQTDGTVVGGLTTLVVFNADLSAAATIGVELEAAGPGNSVRWWTTYGDGATATRADEVINGFWYDVTATIEAGAVHFVINSDDPDSNGTALDETVPLAGVASRFDVAVYRSSVPFVDFDEPSGDYQTWIDDAAWAFLLPDSVEDVEIARTRIFPLDGSSAARVYPPPRTGRLVGGHR